jgi:hypothetical protein
VVAGGECGERSALPFNFHVHPSSLRDSTERREKRAKGEETGKGQSKIFCVTFLSSTQNGILHDFNKPYL